MKRLIIVAAALSLAGAADAEVVDSSPSGFEIRHTATIAAPPAKVWAAIGQPAAWWNSSHTWSGSAKNLSLDLRAGGCWCETLPNGGARHMEVIFVNQGKALRLAGALGPLSMTGAGGGMSLTLGEKDGGTVLTWTYDVGGYVKGGVDKFAGPVDFVLGEQFGRLKKYVETGKPD